LTIGHFVNNYLDKSIDSIRDITKSAKVMLFGYCWGGDLALMYSALHPEKVKSLVTVATPGDFDLDNSLLSDWTKAIESAVRYFLCRYFLLTYFQPLVCDPTVNVC
jgi:polyhydroxyalkanoate synthase subunit PhaC